LRLAIALAGGIVMVGGVVALAPQIAEDREPAAPPVHAERL